MAGATAPVPMSSSAAKRLASVKFGFVLVASLSAALACCGFPARSWASAS